jgi:hypothetical protein
VVFDWSLLGLFCVRSSCDIDALSRVALVWSGDRTLGRFLVCSHSLITIVTLFVQNVPLPVFVHLELSRLERIARKAQ